MKILAFTDNHGSFTAIRKVKQLAAKEKVDIILHAGDISVFGRELDKLIDEVGKIGKPVLILHGNHETKEELKKAVDRNKHNIIYLHKASTSAGNVMFLGYGGGGFALSDPRFLKQAVKFKKAIEAERKKNPNVKTVFMAHGPPYGTKLDMVLDSHVGSKDYVKFCKENKIDLMICGHIHECEEREDKIGSTLVVNPGPYGRIFEF